MVGNEDQLFWTGHLCQLAARNYHAVKFPTQTAMKN